MAHRGYPMDEWIPIMYRTKWLKSIKPGKGEIHISASLGHRASTIFL